MGFDLVGFFVGGWAVGDDILAGVVLVLFAAGVVDGEFGDEAGGAFAVGENDVVGVVLYVEVR